MGAIHFLTKTLKRVSTEMSLQVLAYNMKRVIAIMGIGPLMQALRPERPDQSRRSPYRLSSSAPGSLLTARFHTALVKGGCSPAGIKCQILSSSRTIVLDFACNASFKSGRTVIWRKKESLTGSGRLQKNYPSARLRESS